jgi:hypothetical protein
MAGSSTPTITTIRTTIPTIMTTTTTTAEPLPGALLSPSS